MVRRLAAIRRGSVFELVFIVAVAICLALAVQAYAVKPYQIPSASMKPTLEVGERVLVNRLSARLGWDPEPGDVVVFHPPVNAVDDDLAKCTARLRAHESDRVCPVPGAEPSDETFIKRVVAGPGDRLSILDGVPVVNGEDLVGGWSTIPCAGAQGCNYPSEVTIPDGQYFMLGDNRPSSDDSRFWGPVPREWIIGEAVVTYWPPDRIGGL